MMAISMEHLGAQVQCPHCAAVVQTPPRSALGPPPGPDPYSAAVQPAPPPPTPPPERESIFAEPEPSEDLFGADMSPKVQMPARARSEHHIEETNHEDDEEQVDLTAMRSRMSQERKAGNLAPTILVFLVPYSIFTTLFLAYLLYTWPRLEAFEWLPDPKKGNAGRVVYLPKHDSPIPAKLKVPLKETIRVGQMEITPQKVSRTPAGDLVLEFKARNISDDYHIKPLDDSFFAEGKIELGSARPFTFLERLGGKETERVYGGLPDFRKGENRVVFHGDLQPNDECIVYLTTEPKEQVRDRIRAMLNSPEANYLWRLQIRRGLTPVHGVETSLTAVIGIEFSKSEVGS